jgi:aspartate/methionine/tyrosine aminotransferase
MFSSRLQWDARRNRLTELLAAKRAQDARILDLTQSNPTHAGFEYPGELRLVFDHPEALRYDPLPAGSPAAREAVAGYYRDRGHDVEPGRILLTASTSEAYSYLFKLLADPGDEVLVPRPSYPLFEYLAKMETVEVRQYPLEYHGRWAIDMDALANAITARTRAVVLVNPNNPTGSYVKRRELEALIRIAAGHDIALISDEVFSDYAFAEDSERVTSLAGVEDCAAFSMSGLSKTAGLPQMKLGWIVVAGLRQQRAKAIEKLEWIADTYLSVSTPVQCAAGRLLELGASAQRQIQQRTAANLGFARRALQGTALDILDVEGGWSVTLRVPRIRTEEEWCLDLLERDNVLVQPGYFYDFENEAFLVASLLTAPGELQEGLTRLVARS